MRLEVRKKNCPPLIEQQPNYVIKIIIIITIELLRRLLCHCLMGKMIYKFLFFIYQEQFQPFQVGVGGVKKSLRVLFTSTKSHKGQKKKTSHKNFIHFSFFFPLSKLLFLSLSRETVWLESKSCSTSNTQASFSCFLKINEYFSRKFKNQCYC